MESWFNEAEAIEKIRSSVCGESFYWKYIRVNGKYRFIDATNVCSPPHKSVLREGETPESAAFVKIRIEFVDGIEVFINGWSLNIGPTKDDEYRLTQLLVFEASAISGHDPECGLVTKLPYKCRVCGKVSTKVYEDPTSIPFKPTCENLLCGGTCDPIKIVN